MKVIKSEQFSKWYKKLGEISEFNYKLLHGILNNNAYVSKWNKDVSPLCEICKDEENIEHLLIDCKIIKTIWEKVSSFLKFDITWKIIVLGFYAEVSDKTLLLNNLIAFITFSMYKYKMKCRLKDEKMSEKNLLFSLKSNLCMQNTVLKMTGCIRNDIYHDIGDYL